MTLLIFIIFFFILGLLMRNKGDNLLDTLSKGAELGCIMILIVLAISLYILHQLVSQ
jgi:hypothetical protein